MKTKTVEPGENRGSGWGERARLYKKSPAVETDGRVKAEATLPHSKKASNRRRSCGVRERSCRFVREQIDGQVANSGCPSCIRRRVSLLAYQRVNSWVNESGEAAREYAGPTLLEPTRI